MTDRRSTDMAVPPPLLAYPLEYHFKIIGRSSDDFEGYVRGLIESVLLVTLDTTAITRNQSRAASYVSLTVLVRLESEAQRAAVYAALHGNERIVYYL